METLPNTVVKDNKLINASYNLNLVEQRLILLAIVRSRETGRGITANDYLDIHASDYVKSFEADQSSTYKSLRDNCKQLFKREFSFIRDKKTILSRWVSTISYDDESATVSLIFAPEVITFISELEKHFTSYDLKDISGLTSAYAVRLYEILTCWKYAKKTPIIETEDFRQRLGVATNEYVDMNNFKRRVLNVAIEQINKFTNLNISCEQHKKGRKISGFSFTIVEKEPSRDPNTIDWVDDTKPKDKYITDAEFMALGSDGSDAYQIAIKAFVQGYKIPKDLQRKYGIEGDKFLQARKEASKILNAPKPKPQENQLILDDALIANIKKTIIKSVGTGMTEEAKQQIIKIEIKEEYANISGRSVLVDANGSAMNEMGFIDAMYKAFNFEVE